ncbi:MULTISPECIES: MarR family transcriptional regulator [Kitasatospora]|uniref:Putative MarR family transcriptional regulator n=1 Tax=Kitasatospora setae (strain ATCC 33774 / DSM 43861 / JCM 3304 / KCC A-0304 / NBRC 14216 / KM-6054) TaxID=452652 RepID=E4N331_KITSK|nr:MULTISPECIES: MarR family transcriptional regulator [Kitasatospora]BAJ32565.1 putative MarR family transcriptional regulator [Kitasatospora setae KM-6054]
MGSSTGTGAAAGTAPSTHELMERVAAVGTAYFQDFAAAAARHGLNSSQAKALKEVLEPVPMRALAGRLGCDASNVTGIVDRLEALGYARREPAATDRRVKIAAITDQGRDVLDRIREDMTRARTAFDSLDPEQRTALAGLCDQVLPLLLRP